MKLLKSHIGQWYCHFDPYNQRPHLIINGTIARAKDQSEINLKPPVTARTSGKRSLKPFLLISEGGSWRFVS